MTAEAAPFPPHDHVWVGDDVEVCARCGASRHLTSEQWIVYTYSTVAGKAVCHAYGSFDNSADAQAGVPFTQEVATELAANINGFSGTGGAPPITAMALPLEQCEQPGI
jgi:hypothetical protein